MNNPLPTECKDLAFARNLIAQMKGEGGRHNSTVSGNRVEKSVASGVVEAQTRHAPNNNRFQYPPAFRRDGGYAIGRFGNHFVRREARYCEIGDVFPFDTTKHRPDAQRMLEPSPGTFNWADITGIQPATEMIPSPMEFKKVGITVTPDNGQTWHEEYFWERVK